MEQRYQTAAAKTPSPSNRSTSLSPCLCLLHPEQKREDAGNRMQRLKPRNRRGETNGTHGGLCERPLRQCRKQPVHHSRAPRAEAGRGEQDLAARWAASARPRRPTSTSTPGELPQGSPAARAGATPPRRAGKRHKTVSDFLLPLTERLIVYPQTKFIVPWWDRKHAFM